MKIYVFADVHLGLLILDAKLFYEVIWLPIMNKIRYSEVDLVVFVGDLFHKSFPKDSDVVTIARRMIQDLITISNSKNHFPIRLIKGTRSHDSDMFETIKDLTKHGHIYNIDTSFLENKILQNVKNSKEYILAANNEGEDSLKDDVESLLNMLNCALTLNDKDKKDNFLIYETPKIEVINGYRILFCPEVYDTDDTQLRELFLKKPDMCFYHGMIEGALEHYQSTKTSLIYNRSIDLKSNLLNYVQLFTVAGHIHTRMAMLPFITNKSMLSISRNLRAWYVGSLYQQNFTDAGMPKGYDIITINQDRTFEIEFIETKNSPKFYVYNMTKEFQMFEVNQIIQAFINRMNRNTGMSRVDIDVGMLSETEKIKVEQFKAKFPNISYKVTNSKQEQMKEESANLEYQKLIRKPIKELILDICDGEISTDDYDRYFSTM